MLKVKNKEVIYMKRTFGGTPVTIEGEEVKVGEMAP